MMEKFGANVLHMMRKDVGSVEAHISDIYKLIEPFKHCQSGKSRIFTIATSLWPPCVHIRGYSITYEDLGFRDFLRQVLGQNP